MFATVATGDDHVRLSALLNAHTTVEAGQDKPFTTSTNQPTIFSWNAHSGRHGNLSSEGDVTLRQSLIFMNHVFGELKESANSLHCDFLVRVQFLRVFLADTRMFPLK